jgi:hypothetical protein
MAMDFMESAFVNQRRIMAETWSAAAQAARYIASGFADRSGQT